MPADTDGLILNHRHTAHVLFQQTLDGLCGPGCHMTTKTSHVCVTVEYTYTIFSCDDPHMTINVPFTFRINLGVGENCHVVNLGSIKENTSPEQHGLSLSPSLLPLSVRPSPPQIMTSGARVTQDFPRIGFPLTSTRQPHFPCIWPWAERERERKRSHLTTYCLKRCEQGRRD